MNAVEQLLGEAAVGRHGARTALACGGEVVSYSSLAGRVRRAAGALLELGVAPGDRVLLLMRDTPELAAAWLGAAYAGAVAVALNTKLSAQEYRHVRGNSGARLALVEDAFVRQRPDLAAEHASGGPRLAVVGEPAPRGAADWRGLLAGASPDTRPFDASPADPAFWLHSSGTTGKPKGIVHAHRAILASGEALRRLGIGPGDRVFTTSKYFFAYGLEHGLLGPLALGATGVALPDWAEPEAAIEAVARHSPTAFFSVPSFYRRLLAEPAERLEPFRRVRHFVAAGERLPVPVIERWRAATGGEILSLYGMSETYCACLLVPPETAAAANSLGRTGLPLPLTEVRLADAAGQEPAAGEPGVLWVRHPALALGYANLPEPTRAQFRDGWFCTQDLFARDPDGYFVHRGRADELVKIAGQWVQPGELEAVVCADEAIAEAACVPVADAEGFERLALFVIARGDPRRALEAAGAACEQGLPRFKRPKWIRSIAELPRTATGKVQRFKLRELLLRELGRP